MNQISYPAIKDKIAAFIKSKVRESGAQGAVIGLSGGIDSTLTAYLTVRALGCDNVLGISLPERSVTSKKDLDDALEVAKGTLNDILNKVSIWNQISKEELLEMLKEI